MQQLLNEIRSCRVCADHLPFDPHPVLLASPKSKIAIIGQAPGTKVHKTGIPWNDPSGILLRQWMQVDEATFYNPDIFAIVPMGFCYPGKGQGGDLPPRPECAPLWHKTLFDNMPDIKLTLLIGHYAQKYYLQNREYKTLAQTVKNYKEFLPDHFPIPHPSPRNRLWLKRNDWFEREVVPVLRKKVHHILNEG